MLFLRNLGKDSGASPGQTLPVSGLVPPIGATKWSTIDSCLCWVWMCLRNSTASNQCQKVIGARLEATYQGVQWHNDASAACLGFVDFSEVLGMSISMGQGQLLIIAAERGSGLCANCVRHILRESPGWGEFDGVSDLAPDRWVRGGLSKRIWHPSVVRTQIN